LRKKRIQEIPLKRLLLVGRAIGETLESARGFARNYRARAAPIPPVPPKITTLEVEECGSILFSNHDPPPVKC
jgi:hypothetical protein